MDTSWAVVTGASSGLGVGFAHELARQGANIMLVARRHETLSRIAHELQQNYRVRTDVAATDLADDADRKQLVELLHSREVHTLVNNAGFGSMGRFTDLDAQRITDEISVNITAVSQLSHAVLPQMARRERGALINVASTGAFQPIPQMAVYAATKSYVLSFSQALWGEYRGTGVRVVCICPGPTDTGFFAAAGNDAVMSQRRSVDDVIATTFSALRARRPYVIDGWRNRLMAEATRLFPSSMTMRIARYIATH